MDTTMTTVRQQHGDILACLRAMMTRLETRCDTSDLRGFLTYFERDVADHFAFQQEALFPSLASDPDFASGPLCLMVAERAVFRDQVTALRRALANGDRSEQFTLAVDIIDLLLFHLTKQELCWFPMVSRVLRRRERRPAGSEDGAPEFRSAADEILELRIRWLVADQLGVDGEELTPDTSLVDDLAADTLDLLEIAQRIENDLGVIVPDREIDRIRTYADLRSALVTLAHRDAAEAIDVPSPGFVRARVVSGDTAGSAAVLRAAPLTPDLAQMIAEDALRADGGARVEISFPAETSDAELARAAGQFAWLAQRDVQVSVQRAQSTTPSVETIDQANLPYSADAPLSK